MQVDRYEVLSEVARGGMGVVYRARDPGLEPGDLLRTATGAPLAPTFAADEFCIVATLPAGRWSVFARADDGVRVWVDGALAIDGTRHALRVRAHLFEVAADRPVELRVE